MIRPLLFLMMAASSIASAADTPTVQQNDAEFESAVQSMMPLTPENIVKFRRMLDKVEAAKQEPLYKPTPSHTSVSVQMSPGSKIPSIRLAPNFVSSLVILDSTGKPWPIEKFDASAAGNFNVQQMSENVLTISPMLSHIQGNIAIKLVDIALPLTVSLSAQQAKELDYVRELKINQLGPNAAPPITTAAAPDVVAIPLNAFLNGVPPNGAKKLELKGAGSWDEVWRYDDRYYLITHAELKSPAYLQKTSAADGTNVFAIDPSLVVLITTNGELRKWLIEDATQ